MIRRVPTAAESDPREPRRQELTRLFAAAELSARPDLPPWRREDTGRRLAGALAAAGPIFAAYGRYLATRPDLVPADVCFELAGIADRAPALGRDEALGCLGAELAGDPWLVLRTLDVTPLASRLLTEERRAVTAEGVPVVLVLLRPGIVEQAEQDVPLLPLLDPAIAGIAAGGRGEELRTGFRRALADALDLSVQATLLTALAREAQEGVVAPPVEARLSTGRLLVRHDLGGRRLAELVELDTAAGLAAAPAAAAELRAAVRRVILLWLRQAFLGRAVPAEPRVDDLEVLPDGRIAFVAGVPAAPPPAVQENLWAHLAATAAQDATAAGDALLREVERLPGAVDEAELMLRLRQVVPFRDGAWSLGGDSLPEHLFAGWRLAGECGYRLRAPALELTRGLASLTALARRVVPADDPLLAGVEELRLARGLGRLRQAADPRTMGADLLPYGQLLLALPEKIDALMTMVARGDVRVRLEASEPARRPGGHRGALVLALAAAALAVGLVVGRLAGSEGIAMEELAGGWGGLLLLLIGGMALRLLSRDG